MGKCYYDADGGITVKSERRQEGDNIVETYTFTNTTKKKGDGEKHRHLHPI